MYTITYVLKMNNEKQVEFQQKCSYANVQSCAYLAVPNLKQTVDFISLSIHCGLNRCPTMGEVST